VFGGHIGVAIGAFGLRQTVPLWLLIIASQLPDWADATLCLANARPVVPGMLSHSVPAVIVLAGVAAAVAYAMSRDVASSGLVALVVASHYVGDYFTGIKPTWPGGPMVGLELYRQPALDFLLESAVIALGWTIYRRSFPPERRSSREVVAVLVVLVMVQLAGDIFFSLAPGLKKC